MTEKKKPAPRRSRAKAAAPPAPPEEEPAGDTLIPSNVAAAGRSVVRPGVTDDGQVRLVHGSEVPGEVELGFSEGAAWIVTPEVAQELADALPSVVQQARTVKHHVG